MINVKNKNFSTGVKKFWLILILALYLLPTGKIYAETPNAGFVPGNIWYSKDPFEEGDKVKIYTIIFNGDTRELSGTVVFFNEDVLLGKKSFVAGAKDVEDVSIDWTVTAGTHDIFARIENAKFLISQGKYEEVYLAGDETNTSSRTVSKKIVKEKESEPLTKVSEKVSDVALGVIDAATGGAASAGKFIEDKTPNILIRPITSTIGAIENLRESAGISLKNSKEETRKEIDQLNKSSEVSEAKDAQSTDKGNEDTGKLTKPFKYIQLSAVALFSGAFNNKFIFYGLLAGLILLLLRYLWRLIF